MANGSPEFSSKRPVLHTSYDGSQGGFRQLRDNTAPISDVILQGAESDFRNAQTAVHLGAALLIETRGSAARYDRLARHIARNGFDHYQLVYDRSGGSASDLGRRTMATRTGDIGLFDMSQPVRSHRYGADGSSLNHVLIMITPRILLSPLLARPNDAHGAVIRGDTPFGRLLGDFMTSVWRQAPDMTLMEGQAVAESLARLVAGALGSTQDAEQPVTQAVRGAALASIQRHIERNLASPDLDAASLCRRFGLSRGTLYRLFERYGGLSRYIQESRLQWAFAALISPAQQHLRIIDIAVECDFASDATFIRAFRRLFGLTPGELRAAAHTRQRAAPDAAASFEGLRWLRELGQGARLAG